MEKKEQLKKELQNIFNELKKEIRKIKEEDFQNFDEYFEKILHLIDEEKMEPNEIVLKKEEKKENKKNDRERFIEYYRDNGGYYEDFINECLDDCDGDYHKTLEKLGEI